MHLHGHDFWIRSSKQSNSNHADIKRDTYLMGPKEKAELIFLANNPGQWLLHCHMLEHMASGMGAVISVV
jgi:FtsP/CotA-like multicopper oxidase with cupredoxin domain